MQLWQDAVVFVASILGGMVNAVAGGGTLLTFPVLILVGVPPITANATNTVGLLPGSLAGAIGFRRDIGAARRWLVLLIGPAIAGGVVGAFLLLRTPVALFDVIAPILVLAATVLLAVQEPLSRRLGRGRSERPSTSWIAAAIAGQLVVAVYGGFFGAGIGILMLAALGLLGLDDIHEMNGLKNVFSVCIYAAAAIYFAASGAVAWLAAGLMATGSLAGGLWGARLAHRFGRRFVRRAVVTIGLLASVSLAVKLL